MQIYIVYTEYTRAGHCQKIYTTAHLCNNFNLAV